MNLSADLDYTGDYIELGTHYELDYTSGWEYLGTSSDGTYAQLSGGGGGGGDGCGDEDGPVITGINPGAGTYGEGDGWGSPYGYIQIFGTGFDPTGCECLAGVSFGQAIWVRDYQVNLYYDDNASVGNYPIYLYTSQDLESNTGTTFVINGDSAPSGMSVNPSNWTAGTSPTITISGSGFGNNFPPQVSFSCCVDSWSPISSSDGSITGTVAVDPAASGTVTITVADRGYNGNQFQAGQGGGGNQGTAQAQIGCATLVNFQQVGPGQDLGSGTLFFNYAWASSSGNLNDLQSCRLQEVVNYPGANPFVFPSPFATTNSYPNPTILGGVPTGGTATDKHSTQGPFQTPYTAASFTATQTYQWQCPCLNNNAWNNITGFTNVSIVRSVAQNPNGSWYFLIQKDGSSATINPLP